MEVSRITFENKTLAALQNPTLNGKRKKELRFKALEEWIDSHPYGTILTGKEFMRVGNFNSDISANGWLKRQAERGKIIRHPANGYQWFYQIPGKVTTRKIEDKAPATDEVVEEALKSAPLPQETQNIIRTYSVSELEQLAMKFNFYASGTATLPAFLMYLQALEK